MRTHSDILARYTLRMAVLYVCPHAACMCVRILLLCLCVLILRMLLYFCAAFARYMLRVLTIRTTSTTIYVCPLRIYVSSLLSRPGVIFSLGTR
jgi:hypothetical protein